MTPILPFVSVRRQRQPLWRRWPWRAGTPIVAVMALWWGLVGMSGVTAITPADHGPVLALAEPFIADGDWPGWRGGSRQGTVSATSLLPVQWTLPAGVGQPAANDSVSPPCVAGESIFLTHRSSERGQTSLICLDRSQGTMRWRVPLGSDEIKANSSVLPTPASDGTRVFVTTVRQGQFAVSAFSMAGESLWSRDAGPLSRDVGPAQSPVVGGSLVYVAIDQKAAPWDWSAKGGYIAALHRQTGQIVWRTPRSGGDGFATPVVALLAGRRQLLLPSRGSLRSYDADSGAELWRAKWSARVVEGAVACDDQHVFATVSGPERETVCVRADGAGDVSETHVVWRAKYAGSHGAPVLVDGNVIVAQDDGGITALDRQNGRVVWQQRLAQRFSTAPLSAGSRLYCLDDASGVTVLDTSQHGQILGQSRSTGPHTVAVSADQLLFVSPTGLTMITVDGPTQVSHGDLPGHSRR